MAEPMMFITPNAEALEILWDLMKEPEGRPDLEPVWETQLTLRITRSDLRRYALGNGDLVQIAFWVEGDNTDLVGFPDPEMPASPFEGEEDSLDKG